MRGHYDGVLEPELHYLPLASDLSDVGEVCERARDVELTSALAARAHADVVASGRYTYGAFARRFEGVVAPLAPAPGPRRSLRAVTAAASLHDQLLVRARPRANWWAYGQLQRRAPRVLEAAAGARRARAHARSAATVISTGSTTARPPAPARGAAGSAGPSTVRSAAPAAREASAPDPSQRRVRPGK